MKSLLNKAINDVDIQNFVLSLDEKPELECFPIEGCYSYKFKKHGFELIFIKDVLTTIRILDSFYIFNNDLASRQKQFNGEFPNGISSDDSFDELIRKLTEFKSMTLDTLPIDQVSFN